MEILFVGLGGFLGSCLRYCINLTFKNMQVNLPLGTLVSNILAGLLIGFIIGIEQQTNLISPKLKLFLTTGFLGGLSTFSTFSLETITLFSSGKYAVGIGNILFNLILSFIGVLCGMAFAKILMSRI